MKKALLVLAWGLALGGSAMAQEGRHVSCENGEKFTAYVIGTQEEADKKPASVVEIAHLDKDGKADKTFTGVGPTEMNAPIYTITDAMRPQDKVEIKHSSDEKFSIKWDDKTYENCSLEKKAGAEKAK